MKNLGKLVIASLTSAAMVLIVIFVANKIPFTKSLVQKALAG